MKSKSAGVERGASAAAAAEEAANHHSSKEPGFDVTHDGHGVAPALHAVRGCWVHTLQVARHIRGNDAAGDRPPAAAARGRRMRRQGSAVDGEARWDAGWHAARSGAKQCFAGLLGRACGRATKRTQHPRAPLPAALPSSPGCAECSQDDVECLAQAAHVAGAALHRREGWQEPGDQRRSPQRRWAAGASGQHGPRMRSWLPPTWTSETSADTARLMPATA